MAGRDNIFKCAICGKYIAYGDIGTHKINSKYVQDTEYTTELGEMWHTNCEATPTKPKGE